MRYIKQVSRRFEFILGLCGSILTIIPFLIAVFSGTFLSFESSLRISPIIGSILGFIACVFLFKDSEIAGVLFIIASILMILQAFVVEAIGSILLLIAGISALFRK